MAYSRVWQNMEKKISKVGKQKICSQMSETEFDSTSYQTHRKQLKLLKKPKVYNYDPQNHRRVEVGRNI